MKTVNKDRVTIRHPEVTELAQVRALVEEVMDQVYHHLLGGTSLYRLYSNPGPIAG